MDDLSIAPIHEVIIERVYKALWRERSTAYLTGIIRRDRDRKWWELVKDIPDNDRRLAGWLHAKPGDQPDDAVFYSAWGGRWREVEAKESSEQAWMANRRGFVDTVCAVMGLPRLPVRPSWHADEPAHKKLEHDCSLDDISIPRRLRRDSLWAAGEKLQVEFAVDNQTLADMAS